MRTLCELPISLRTIDNDRSDYANCCIICPTWFLVSANWSVTQPTMLTWLIEENISSLIFSEHIHLHGVRPCIPYLGQEVFVFRYRILSVEVSCVLAQVLDMRRERQEACDIADDECAGGSGHNGEEPEASSFSLLWDCVETGRERGGDGEDAVIIFILIGGRRVV